jgi:hypothetical protein
MPKILSEIWGYIEHFHTLWWLIGIIGGVGLVTDILQHIANYPANHFWIIFAVSFVLLSMSILILRHKKKDTNDYTFIEDPGFYVHKKTQTKYCGKCFSQNKLNPLSFHVEKGLICRSCGESYVAPYDYESAWKQASKEKKTIISTEEKINLEYLRDTAHQWIKDHPVIKSIYLVTANRPNGKEIHAHYQYTLIAIVPHPDDDYRNWAGDGFNYNFPEDDVNDCGLVDFSWVTFTGMDEAREYVNENIKDNLQKGVRVKWDDLTSDIQSKEFNVAASAFRNKILTELIGFYPINLVWNKKDWHKIRESIPVINSAAAEFKYFVTFKDDFDKALNRYNKYCNEKTEEKVFALAYPTMGYGGVEEHKKEFDGIVKHLLSFTEKE